MRAGRRRHVGSDDVATRNRQALADFYSRTTRLNKCAFAYPAVCCLGGSARRQQRDARKKDERGDRQIHIATSDTGNKVWGDYSPGHAVQASDSVW